MMTDREILLHLFGLGSIALIVGGFQAAGNQGWRHFGRPVTMGVVGISFMLAAGVAALAELPNMEQLPPARTFHLRDELRLKTRK
ncbi:hypothetical protein [Streptosporangium sp. 'caverna']|uniref:hypothetical protein n=1 Tax=Streptosporangium sp. 'caverna' TaxID=2202249 RepID=UPI000D7E7C7F|nr:hypothetical protein [Streptosporangium sp. 'caverna']AWS40293.1 hypothetical protein DKM19_02045 [Streptosporangium sp. 'caverna']